MRGNWENICLGPEAFEGPKILFYTIVLFYVFLGWGGGEGRGGEGRGRGSLPKREF